MPPLREMADTFIDRDDGEGNEISYDDHVSALSELFVSAMVMLAEHKVETHTEEGIEVHVLIKPPGEDEQDHVTITAGGYRDVRCAIAALACLEKDGYIDQLWNLHVNGKIDPQGPQVVVHNHTIGRKKEESA